MSSADKNVGRRVAPDSATYERARLKYRQRRHPYIYIAVADATTFPAQLVPQAEAAAASAAATAAEAVFAAAAAAAALHLCYSLLGVEPSGISIHGNVSWLPLLPGAAETSG